LNNKRILILKLSSLGDILHTLPVLRALRENQPSAYIAWMVEERYRDLLEGNSYLDEIITVRTKAWRKNWSLDTLREINQSIQKMRQSKFDTVLDLHGLLKTGIIAGLSGAKRRIGFPRQLCKEKISAWFTNVKGPRTGIGTHVVELNHSLAKLAGAGDLSPAPLTFQVPPAAEEKIDGFIKNQSGLADKPRVAINPGAGFESKQWDLIRFANLADRIVQDLGYEVILTWGPGEESKVATIAEKMEQSCHIAPATSVVESIALYKRLDLMVSCDSGPLHMCAGLGIPTVSIFGPTDPDRNGAYGTNHEVVCKKLPCSYCWKRSCPLGTRECMDSVQVEEVFSAVKESATKYIHPLNPTESSTITNTE